jgi:diguanylate cyclase (GGDEF)-like protein/PAS domain S-box-containing protein
MVGVILLECARSVSYLLFHTVVEIFAIVVSVSILLFVWVGRRYITNGYLIVLGGSYGVIALMDVFHTLTFRGMNILALNSLNFSPDFWLSARLLEGGAFVIAPMVIKNNPNLYKVFFGFLVTAFFFAGIIYYEILPDAYIADIGLTPFKIFTEYFIITLMIIGFGLLRKNKQHFEPRIYLMLAASLLFAIASEFFFTAYIQFNDLANTIGHYFRFMSVTLGFVAIVLSSIGDPLKLIFRELNNSRQELAELNRAFSASDEQLNRAQRIGKVGSWHLDIVNQTHAWSNETYRIFGEPIGKAISFEDFLSHIHPEDRERVSSNWNAALNSKSPYDIEHRILVGGEIRWVREMAEIQFSQSGLPIDAVGTVQDISERKIGELKLRESEDRFRLAFSASPDAININRVVDGCYIDCNETFIRMTGYKREEIIGKTSVELGIWNNANDRSRLVAAMVESGTCLNLEAKFVMKGGKLITGLMSAHQLEISGEQCILSVTRDISERKKMLDEIEQKQIMIQTLVHAIPDLVWFKDTNGVYLSCNRRFEDFFGAQENQIVGKTDFDFVSDELAKSFQENDRKAMLKGVASMNEEWISFARDGHRELLETTKVPIFHSDGQIIGVLGIGHNITLRKLMEQQVHELAHYDSLTHLPNRRLLNDRLMQSKASSKRHGHWCALMFLDLDNFKPLNDVHGHSVGDLLLIQVAGRLKGCVREIDTVARFGGDEFIVLINELDVDEALSVTQAKNIAEKIHIALSASYHLQQAKTGSASELTEYECTASIGIVLFNDHEYEFKPDDVLKMADLAMYQAKEAGGNNIRFYEKAV